MIRDDQSKLLFGVIVIVALGIVFLGNKLSVDEGSGYRDKTDRSCISVPETVQAKTNIKTENIPEETGKPWTYANNTYLSGYPKSISNQRLTAKTLKTAIQICTQIKDCGGITKVENDYELRAGKSFMTSEDGEESWVHDKPQFIPAPENTNCVGLPSTVVKEENILRSFPKLRSQRSCGKDGFYHYNDKYAHLNSLIKFSTRTKYPSLLEPSPCPVKSENKTLVLFGIKSMSSHVEQRKAIRSTWLNPKYWNFSPNIEIHHIFLLGVEDGATVSEDEQKYKDILQTDFIESHYNLSLKDHNLFSFIDDHCGHADFIFKGDDDILLVPENAMYHIDTIRDSETYSMTGCLKKAQPANRHPESKYYAPTDLIPEATLPSYFAGAGYFMSKSALAKILEIRNTVPILHLDDVYVGKLINAAGLTGKMRQSVSICTGVHAFEEAVYTKAANSGWGLKEAPTHPCFMSGITVFHRFIDPKEMEKSFKLLKDDESNKKCTDDSITNFAARWMKKTAHHFIADEFRIMCNNYANPIL